MTRRNAARKTLAVMSRRLSDAMLDASNKAKAFNLACANKRRAEAAFRGALLHAIERKAL